MAAKNHDVGLEMWRDCLTEWLAEMQKPRTLDDHCRLINLGLRTGKLRYLGIQIDGTTYRVHELVADGEETIIVRTKESPRAKIVEHHVPADTTAWRMRSERFDQAMDAIFNGENLSGRLQEIAEAGDSTSPVEHITNGKDRE